MERLKQKLRGALRSNEDGEQFIAREDLKCIMNEEAVERAILESNISAGKTDDTVQFILRSARKTFGTLLFAGCSHHILTFIKYDNTHEAAVDSKLPLRKDSLEYYGLNTTEAEGFFRNQWQFIAPIFDVRSVLPRAFEKHMVLPFERSGGEGHIGGGTFGEVFSVFIDRRHQEFHPDVSFKASMSGRRLLIVARL